MRTFLIRLGTDRDQVYQRFTYPAGETQVRLLPEQVDGVRESEKITVVARVRSAEDIVELALLVDAIRGVNEDAVLNVVLPYLPYGRADRRFTPGDCFGLEVFTAILGTFWLDGLITLDAHSDVFFRELGMTWYARNVPATPWIEAAIGRFAARTGAPEIVVLFPDKGAHDRYKVPEMVGCNTEVTRVKTLYATKRRNPTTGKFEGFDVPAPEEFEGLPVLIVDDICDGGGTFVGIAELLPRGLRKGLYVTHGIFSKGVEVLTQHFEKIYTTNSFPVQETAEVEVFDALRRMVQDV